MLDEFDYRDEKEIDKNHFIEELHYFIDDEHIDDSSDGKDSDSEELKEFIDDGPIENNNDEEYSVSNIVKCKEIDDEDELNDKFEVDDYDLFG